MIATESTRVRRETLSTPVCSETLSAGLGSETIVPGKIQPHHRDRLAVVYVRQSSPQQVLEHRESTALQYALRGAAQYPCLPRLPGDARRAPGVEQKGR